MVGTNTKGAMEVALLNQQLEDAQQKIADLEDKLSRATEVQQAGTVLLIASLVHRLGGEVVLSNSEMAAVKGELHSHETFGGRVFRLIPDLLPEQEEGT